MQSAVMQRSCRQALSSFSPFSTGQMDAQDGVASNEPWIYGLEWHGKDGFHVRPPHLPFFKIVDFQLY